LDPGSANDQWPLPIDQQSNFALNKGYFHAIFNVGSQIVFNEFGRQAKTASSERRRA
jgi:hypothetical protein